jgi:hypothetical protein
VAHHVDVDPSLCEELQRVVNMSSRQSAEWLRTRSAGDVAEELPDRAGTGTGRRVLEITRKRRVDLDSAEEHPMRTVVDRVHARRSAAMESEADQQNWRHRLMTIGHAPLKESR